MSEDRPKFTCIFCQRAYRGVLVNSPLQIFKINCQHCLVDFQFENGKLFLIDYRLHDPVLKMMRVWVFANKNLNPHNTQICLQYKQKKIKNPPPHNQFSFNTARVPNPKDALAHAKRLIDLLIFS